MSSLLLDFNENNGLVLCQNKKRAKNNAELLYLSEVEKLGASAVFFRRFYKNEEEKKPYHSEPAVCIFNKENETAFFNSQAHKELHAALWSAGKTEVYVIQGKTTIDIINARRPAEVKNDNQELSLESLKLADAALSSFNAECFSAYLFGTGTFWEQTEYENQLDEKYSPYSHLLDYLMQVRETLLAPGKLGLDPSTIDKLLIVCILVKFLEEIKDDNGRHTLRSIYKKHKVENFAEAIERGHCIDIIEALAFEFNGKVFDRFSDAEKNIIRKANLDLLSQFFLAKLNYKTKQLFIWEQYNFKFLPAEVISAIYENFIQAEALRQEGKPEKGIVYTPIHLVNLMIDESMPLDKPELFKDKSFKVLDPACGSGVFLVAAYKRLLQWWAINNSEEEAIQYPKKEVALQILVDNIFGVDIKETATLVSIFGLTTCLLDKLTPQEIWNNLKFTDLSKNNIKGGKSFFEWAPLSGFKEKSFNLMIGNPPFNPISGIGKKDAVTDEELKFFGIKSDNIPNNNLAIKFLEAAFFFGRKVSMIIPSNVLLYSKDSQKYRNRIFSKFTVEKIYDFTHLRRDLFHKTADTPVVAILALNQPSKQEPIEHIVVKRTISTEKKIRFEIDHYDTHLIPSNWVVDENKQFIWKTNLLGGGQLFHLIYKLSLLDNFGSLIKKYKKENSEWTYSVGYKLNGSNKLKTAKYIFEKETIVTKSFDENEAFLTFIETNKEFAEPRDEKIYQPPHLIFKVNIGKKNIPIHYSDKYLCFKDKLIGIHSPIDQANILKEIYNKFKSVEYSKLSKLWILATSAEAMVNLETACKKEDIDSLPYPENSSLLFFSKDEELIIDDIFRYYIHLGKSISKRGDGKSLHQKANKNQLIEFGKTFCEAINEIYAKPTKSLQLGKIYQTELFTICQFGFGENNGLSFEYLSELDDTIKSLIENTTSNSGVVYQRVIRIYQHINGYDCMFFIKPNAQRYWLNSIALRDADETFEDLIEAGF